MLIKNNNLESLNTALYDNFSDKPPPPHYQCNNIILTINLIRVFCQDISLSSNHALLPSVGVIRIVCQPVCFSKLLFDFKLSKKLS